MRSSLLRCLVGIGIVLSVSCTKDSDPPVTDPCATTPPPAFDVGDDGAADPLSIPAGQARAGRVEASELPRFPSGLETWRAGDFLLANERIAMVIEDAGDSDQYDPWGGKPVGIARVENGQLVDVADFGEILFMILGPSSLVAEHVGVVNDGSDGNPAVVRAEGRVSPLPFIYGLAQALWLGEQFRANTRVAMDYVLPPGESYVDIYVRVRRAADIFLPFEYEQATMHAFMFTYRLLPFQPNGRGFDRNQAGSLPYWAFAGDTGVAFTYELANEQPLVKLVEASGFVGSLQTVSNPFPGCEDDGQTAVKHARIYIGGPDLDAVLHARATDRGETLRAITGTLTDASGAPQAGVHVHAVRASDESHYLSRTTTASDGTFTLHVPPTESVNVYAYERGFPVAGPATVTAPGTSAGTLAFGATGTLHVDAAVDGVGTAIPYKVQVLPVNGTTIPAPRGNWGEGGMPTTGRLYEEFVLSGESLDLRVPAGEWKVVVSRGFRYELHQEVFTVDESTTAPITVTPVLDESVSLPGILCADFHIHTRLSNDAPDDPTMKLRAALAEGLELPVRSEHEVVGDWDAVITGARAEGGLDQGQFALGVGSVELSTMERYGHFGVVPLDEDPDAPNGGTPLWQSYPTANDLDAEFEELWTPARLFQALRQRPEQPMIIVNHPRGNTNYFGYVGLDPLTGSVRYPERYSDDFDAIEVFNDTHWLAARNTTVADWFSFLNKGVHMVAVGASDSHSVNGSPMGYARTCLDFNGEGISSFPTTATARRAFMNTVRDVTMAGHAAVNGGIFVDARVSGKGPGETATGLGTTAMLSFTVRAASWVDFDAVDIVVDGVTVDTIPVDACNENGTLRCDMEVPIAVGAVSSYVVVAAYGDSSLEPVMRNRIPYGVTNAIYLER